MHGAVLADSKMGSRGTCYESDHESHSRFSALKLLPEGDILQARERRDFKAADAEKSSCGLMESRVNHDRRYRETCKADKAENRRGRGSVLRLYR